MNEAVATLLIVFLSFLVGATVFMIPLRNILFAWMGAKLGKDKILVCLVDTARSRGLWKTARLKTPGVYEYTRGVGEDKKPLTHVLTVSNGCMVRFLGVDVAYVIPGDTAAMNFLKVVRVADENGEPQLVAFQSWDDSSLISNYGKRSATVPKLNSGLNFDLKTLLIVIVVAVGGFILFKLLMGGGLGGEETAANVVSNTTTVIS